MRQLPREWRAAMAERGADTRRLVVFYTVNGVREFVSGGTPLFGLPASVVSVSPHASSLDVWTRALSISERHVRLALDTPTRDMLVTEHLAGCRVEVYLGTSTLPRSAWIREWWGQVLNPVPEGNGVTIRCGDVGSMLRNSEVRGSWVAMHHLDIVRDILARTETPTELYDYASLDPRLHAELSHWNLSRAGIDGNDVDPEVQTSPINAWSAIQELVGMTGGALRFDHRMRMRFDPYDRRKAPVRHWTADKISNFRMLDVAGNRCDELSIEFGRVSGQEPCVYRARVPGAAALHRFEGHGERAAAKKITLPWVHGRAFFDVDIPAWGPGSETFSLFEAERNGFAGFRHARFGQPQDPWDGVSAERAAYILIDQEIMEVFSINYVRGASFRAGTFGQPGVVVPVFYPFNLETNIHVARGRLGTARVDHRWASSGGAVYDVTVPVQIALDRARFAHGVPVVEFVVPLTEMDVELTDFVSFDEPRCVFHGCAGASADQVWEMIGQAVDESSSTPGIRVTLAFAYHFTPTGEPVDNEVEIEPVYPASVRAGAMVADERVTRLVVEDLLPVAATGRNLTIPEGNVDGTGRRERQRREHTVELAASRDSYVRFSVQSRAITIEDVAVGDPAPALRRGSVPLAMVRTDATTITAITDQRPTRPLDGARLVDASVASARIAYPLNTEVSVMESTGAASSRWAKRVAAVETTNATTASALVLSLAAKTGGLLKVEVGATRAATDHTGAWRITARVVHNGTSASVVAQTAEYTSRDDVAWSIALTPSGDDIHIRVTGAASQTINWTVAAEFTVADTN